MTRKIPLALLPVPILLALTLLLVRQHASDPSTSILEHPLPAAVVEEEEHAADRAAFELLRTRDPATGNIPADMRRRELAFAGRLPVRTGLFGPEPETLARAAGGEWMGRGPWNVGGRVRGLAIDLADPTHATLLAGAVSGGLWRSTDDGQSWALTSGSSQLHNVSCIAQDPRAGHQQTWYYGTGEGIASSPARGGDLYRGDGVFKSVDGGVSWQVLPATSTGLPQVTDQPFDVVWALAVDPSEAVLEEVYAAARGVICRSTDGGVSWNVVLGDPALPSKAADIVIRADGVLYASLSSDGGVHGIFRSSDGLGWTEITPTALSTYGRIELGLAPSSPQLLYAVVSEKDGSSLAGFFRYQESAGGGGGGSWSDYSSIMLQFPHPEGVGTWPLYTQRGYCTHIDVDPTDAQLCYLGGVMLWRSPLGFSSTTGIERVGGWLYPDPEHRTHHADLHALVFPPGSTGAAYTASDGGVHKTLDAQASPVQWSSLNNGLVTTQFYTVALDEDRPGDPVLVGGTQDNGTLWTNEGGETASWREHLGGDGAACDVLDASAGDYLFSYYLGHVYRYLLDADGNELAFTRVDPVGGTGYLFITPQATDPADRRMLYLGSGSGVWRNSNVTAIPLGSDDATSVNWDRLSYYPSNDPVSAMAVSARGDHPLYYGTAGGRVYRIDFASTAASGTNLNRLDYLSPLPAGAYVSAIDVDPDDDQRILLSFGNYNVPSVWLSEDGGRNWIDVEGNLAGEDGPSIRCVAWLPYGSKTLAFVGTSTGLYGTARLEGSSTLWEQEAPERLGNVIVDALATRPADRLIVAATHGRGMASLTLPDPTAAPIPRLALRLSPNVPNPFNPRTEIRFELPAEGAVRLEILDLRGRRVRSLVEGVRPAGENRAAWDGTDDGGVPVASGTYLYRLRFDGEERSRKMSLVR